MRLLTCTCKKCRREVPAGSHCPTCGAALPASRAHLLWEEEHLPIADWAIWNSAARVVLPVTLVVLAAVVAAEALHGGLAAVGELLRGPLLASLAWLLGGSALLLALVLLLRGRDIQRCVMDNRGVEITTLLPEPNPVKLLLRGRAPRVEATGAGEYPAVAVQRLSWKDVARVQLWPEKHLILLYAPRYFLRLAIPCSLLTWADALDCVREKLGKKKKVRLPASLRTAAKPAPKQPARPKRPAGPAADEQDLLTDIRSMNAELEREDKKEAARKRK